MTKERYDFLMKNDLEKLTSQEIKDGYHFCCEWDGLLIHADDPEAFCCTCVPKTEAQILQHKKWRQERDAYLENTKFDQTAFDDYKNNI